MLYKYNKLGMGRQFRRRPTLAGREALLGKTAEIAHDFETKEARSDRNTLRNPEDGAAYSTYALLQLLRTIAALTQFRINVHVLGL